MKRKSELVSSKGSQNVKKGVGVYEIEGNLPVANILVSNSNEDNCETQYNTSFNSLENIETNTVVFPLHDPDIPRAISVEVGKGKKQKRFYNWKKATFFIFCAVVSCSILAALSYLIGKLKKNESDDQEKNTLSPSNTPSTELSLQPFNLWKKVGEDVDGTSDNHNSGESVSLSHDGFVIGVGSNTGASVYIYRNSTWKQLGDHILFCDATSIDVTCDKDTVPIAFGVALSADGMRIASGAAYSNFGIGFVHEFDKEESKWKQMGETMHSENLNDQFGSQVDISSKGDRAVFYAFFGNYINVYDLIHTNEASNTSFSYEWNKTTTIELPSIRMSDGKSISLSGDGHRIAKAVSISRGILVFSDNQADSIGTWAQLDQNLKSKFNIYEEFGNSVSLSENGKRIVVGAHLSNLYGLETHSQATGRVEVLDYNTSSNEWVQIGNHIYKEDMEGLRSGFAVDISSDGTRIISGGIGPHVSTVSSTVEASVHVYELIENIWVQLGESIFAESREDLFGYSVALSGNGANIALGAPSNDSPDFFNSGHVRIFSFNKTDP